MLKLVKFNLMRGLHKKIAFCCTLNTNYNSLIIQVLAAVAQQSE